MKVLFVGDNQNIYGLYFPIAAEFKKRGADVIFLDPQSIYRALQDENSILNSAKDDGFSTILWNQKSPGWTEKIRLIRTANKILKSIQPNIIFVPFEFHLYFFLVNLANQRGIKTCHVQHGLWGPGKFLPSFYHDQLSRKAKAKLLIERTMNLNSLVRKLINFQLQGRAFCLLSQFYICSGEFYKKQALAEVNYRKDIKIINAGGLRYRASVIKPPSDIFSFYKLDRSLPLITYFFNDFKALEKQFSPLQDSYETLREFYDICNSETKGQFNFLVLMHPTQQNVKDTLRELFLVNKNVSIGITHENQFDIYKNSFLISGVRSGSFKEALVSSSYILKLNYVLKRKWDLELDSCGAIEVCNSREELHSKLSNILKGNNKVDKDARKKFLSKYFDSSLLSESIVFDSLTHKEGLV